MTNFMGEAIVIPDNFFKLTFQDVIDGKPFSKMQLFFLLSRLADEGGHIEERKKLLEIHRKIWPDTFDEDMKINQCVSPNILDGLN